MSMDGVLRSISEQRDECDSHVFDVDDDPGGMHLRCVDCGAVELL